jgi:hypothetical protein
MKIPEFTAQASLYKTHRSYRSSGLGFNSLPYTQRVEATYIPGPETQATCSNCLDGCAATLAQCSLIAAAPLLACFFPPACPGAAATSGALLAACDVASLACIGRCQALRCCPKACGVPNPLNPGEGCCDENENCVDRYDLNSRQGCCPSDQKVCAGKCCARGEFCCGDTCCPAGFFCRDGLFCESQFIGDFPNTPPPPPPVNNCIFGGAPCGNKCCPPGLECCGVFNGQPDCKTSCLH